MAVSTTVGSFCRIDLIATLWISFTTFFHRRLHTTSSAIRDFTEKEVAPRDKWMDENGFDWGVYNKLCETGLVGVHFPEEYGGAGCDAVTSTIVIHELAKGSASMALALDITGIW